MKYVFLAAHIWNCNELSCKKTKKTGFWELWFCETVLGKVNGNFKLGNVAFIKVRSDLYY